MLNLLIGALVLFLPIGVLAYRGVQLSKEGNQLRGLAALLLAVGGGLLYLLWLADSIKYYQSQQPLLP